MLYFAAVNFKELLPESFALWGQSQERATRKPGGIEIFLSGAGESIFPFEA